MSNDLLIIYVGLLSILVIYVLLNFFHIPIVHDNLPIVVNCDAGGKVVRFFGVGPKAKAAKFLAQQISSSFKKEATLVIERGSVVKLSPNYNEREMAMINEYVGSCMGSPTSENIELGKAALKRMKEYANNLLPNKADAPETRA